MRRLAATALSIVTATAGLSACGGGGDGMELIAYFDKAVSLYEGSDVRVLGLNAGSIEEIEVEDTRIKVVMSIKDDVPVPADVHAALVPQSLIGERFVQLAPAWTEGQPRAEPGDVIPLERTSIPVEPDEALAALKEFLDTLDPDATGRLVNNLAEDLDGIGQNLNDALRGLSDLTATFADKDQELASIVEQFDQFAATLRTRENQLGRVIQGFADTASLLAQERQQIEQLVGNLAQLADVGLDLVSRHSTRLERDIEVLTRTLRSVQVNIDSVTMLLESAPVLVAGNDLDGQGEGLVSAWDPAFQHIDLRAAITPALATLLDSIGLPGICVPVDTQCETTIVPLPAVAASPTGSEATAASGGDATGDAAAAPPPATATTSTTAASAGASPIDSIMGLLGSSSDPRRADFLVGDEGAGGSESPWPYRVARALVRRLA